MTPNRTLITLLLALPLLLVSLAAAPVAAQSDDQTWHLSTDEHPEHTDCGGETCLRMWKDTNGGGDGPVTVESDTWEIWLADVAPGSDVDFGDQVWTAQFACENLEGNALFPGELTFRLGSLDPSDASFTEAASASLENSGISPCDGTTETLELDPEGGFSVLEGHYLALNISANGDAGDPDILTGSSSLQHSGSGENYPVPELASIALLGTGLLIVGGTVWSKRRKA